MKAEIVRKEKHTERDERGFNPSLYLFINRFKNKIAFCREAGDRSQWEKGKRRRKK